MYQNRNENHKPRKAPNSQNNTKRAQIEEINKSNRLPLSTFEGQENFNWPPVICYMGFVMDFKSLHMKKRVAFLDNLLVTEGRHRPITKEFSNEEGDDQIINLSFAMDIIQQARDDPELVYKVLKAVALMNLDEAGHLVLRYVDGLFEEEDNTALWADTLRRHGAYVLDKIRKSMQAQDEFVKEVIRQSRGNPEEFTFKLPAEIIQYINVGDEGRDTFLFLDTKEQIIRPFISVMGELYYLQAFIKPIVEKVLEKKPIVSALVIYKILKKGFSIRVEKGRFLDGRGRNMGKEFETLIEPVKDDLIALLLAKKAKHNSLISSLVTRKVGSAGPESINMLFLCGDENCVPIHYSDQLLSWLSKGKYISQLFLDIVFKTLARINPNACFLPNLGAKFKINESERFEMTEIDFDSNSDSDNHFIKYIEKYKIKYIDTCVGRVMQSGRQERPLIAIPFSFDIFDILLFGPVGSIGHANMLIVDPNKRECEHFEPHGEFFGGLDNKNMEKKFNDEIRRFLAELCNQLFPGYTFIPSSEAKNFQAVLNEKFENSIHGGTCQIWSIWYAYLRISHPEYPREVILKKSRDLLAQNDFAELERFIIKFMEQLNAIAGIYKVGDKYYSSNGSRI